MSDVARLAGVGTMTVSRVLSGTVRVSADTTQRVQTAIEQLKYRPNVLARAFRGQRSHSIGLIIPYLYDPFFASCAHAVTTVAKERGYSVIITTSDEDPETEYAAADEMLQRHVDGVLVIPARVRNSRLTRALFGKTPVVAFDRPVSDPSIDTVLVQNAIGIAPHHRAPHRARPPAYHVHWAQPEPVYHQHSLSWLSSRHAGCGTRVCPIFDCNSEEIAEQIIKAKMAQDTPPTAVITSNTLVTRYVLGAISRLGLRIPNDLAFAGFDDFDLAEFTSPPLTVVRQPAQEMGRVAANLLFDRIARGETPHTGNRIVLPVEIVLRRSCGCKHRTPVVIH